MAGTRVIVSFTPCGKDLLATYRVARWPGAVYVSVVGVLIEHVLDKQGPVLSRTRYAVHDGATGEIRAAADLSEVNGEDVEFLGCYPLEVAPRPWREAVA